MTVILLVLLLMLKTAQGISPITKHLANVIVKLTSMVELVTLVKMATSIYQYPIPMVVKVHHVIACKHVCIGVAYFGNNIHEQ